MNSAILLVADDNYLPHAKALFVNCKREGNWQGEFCLMCPSNTDTSTIEGRGIDIFRTAEPKWSYKVKYHIFNIYFRKWNRVLYMDCDCIVQRDLNVACQEIAPRLPKILTDSHEGTILDDYRHFDPNPDDHPELYERFLASYPHATKQIRTSDVMFFDPYSIPDGTVQKMFAIQEDVKQINPTGADQQVMNLAIYDLLEPAGKNFVTWWAFDDPGNRVASEHRGWRGDEFPAIIHYWTMYAPWLWKASDAGAYFNHRLNRPCYDIYKDNRLSFEEVFPRK